MRLGRSGTGPHEEKGARLEQKRPCRASLGIALPASQRLPNTGGSAAEPAMPHTVMPPSQLLIAFAWAITPSQGQGDARIVRSCLNTALAVVHMDPYTGTGKVPANTLFSIDVPSLHRRFGGTVRCLNDKLILRWVGQLPKPLDRTGHCIKTAVCNDPDGARLCLSVPESGPCRSLLLDNVIMKMIRIQNGSAIEPWNDGLCELLCLSTVETSRSSSRAVRS